MAKVVVTILLLAQAVLAGQWRVGKYAGEFMSVGVGARALGMGGAHVAVAKDVTAGYWNPAGLAWVTFPQLAAMHAERFAGVVNYDYVGAALPLGHALAVGLTITRTAVDDIPITTRLRNPELALGELYTENGVVVRNTPYIEKYVTDAEWVWAVSVARARSSSISYGATAKVVHKGVGSFAAWGVGFDLGARWNPIEHLVIGGVVQDVTTTVLVWDSTGTREFVLPTAKWGLAYPLSVRWLRGTITPAVDVDIKFEGRKSAAQMSLGQASADWHFGIEYAFRQAVALRAGSDVGRLTFGLGVRLPQLDVDYAYLSHDQLGATHRISLQLTIQKEKFGRREK
ncbi:MAG: PorV/PorQ family protein [candidate division KSB1 bacterium]|nr:PorV/PorQ family protein [candidate division KSB1 bacterium]MDZ7377791.1 PorV/PorQ family protein [candidate division KSB1 bacterium]